MAAMQAHVAVVWVAEEACNRVRDLCREEGNRQPAVEVGALGAMVAAMQARRQVTGCAAQRNVCCGNDAAALASKQRAAEAGALETAVAAMQAHRQVAEVQRYGCGALLNVCGGTGAAAMTRKQRTVRAGGRRAAAAAMQAYPGFAEVQRIGQKVVGRIGG